MKIRNLFIVTMCLLFLASLSGCMSIIQDSIINDMMEDADQVITNMPPVEEGQSRLVIYWKGMELGGIGLLDIILENDKGYAVSGVMDRTASVIDMPAGRYCIKEGFHDGKGITSTDLIAKAGDTCFLKICRDTNLITGGPNVVAPEFVSQAQALSEMKTHNIKRGTEGPAKAFFIPFDKTGFTPYSTTMNDKQLRNKALDFNVPSDVCRIYLIQYMGFGSNMFPFTYGLDSEPIHKMKSKTFVCYEVRPGKHLITAGSVRRKRAAGALQIDTVGGQCYFYKMTLNERGVISSEEGQKILKKCKLIKNGYMKESK